jgi:hypothetical protein
MIPNFELKFLNKDYKLEFKILNKDYGEVLNESPRHGFLLFHNQGEGIWFF